MNLYQLLQHDEETVKQIIYDIDRYYISYSIKKKSGKYRRIDAPQFTLKELQEKILYKILYKYKPHPIAHGFVKNKSPKTNAQVHVGAKTLINLDINNFFNSINENTVYDTLQYLFDKRLPYDECNENDIKIIQSLLTYRKRIPQGAITSPAITNLIMLRIDKNLTGLKNKFKTKLKITRYCDDISLSSQDILTKAQVKSIIEEVKIILILVSLRLNDKKTKVKKYYHRMKVTGVIVNEKINVPRERWRNLRAQLHNLFTEDLPLTEIEAQKIRGSIEWVKSLNPQRGMEFSNKFEKILNMPGKLITETKT